MTREEKEQIGKYVLQMARLLEDGCYQQEILLKAVHIIDEALEQESCEDWYEVPSYEMTLEQARQAVKDLRKKLMEYLEQEPTTKNDLGVDAVSRQAVLDLIADYDLSMGQVVKGIHALPSVTPQEPRKGHWITRPHVYGVTYCSECDFELKIDDTNYCPNCGAKMEKRFAEVEE